MNPKKWEYKTEFMTSWFANIHDVAAWLEAIEANKKKSVLSWQVIYNVNQSVYKVIAEVHVREKKGKP